MKQIQEIQITSQYLNLPVKNGAPMYQVRLRINGEIVRFFDIELAPDEPDFWVFADVSDFQGQLLQIEVEPAGDGKLPAFAIPQSDTIKGSANLYSEKHRPQFHFTSRRGWLNDPNGLVYYQGTYYLFYQHNPYGWQWGNMHWGHATSKDLVHWQEVGDVLHPDAMGTMYSGSAVVDWQNTSGLKYGADDLLVAFYTAAGQWAEPAMPYTQCMAYSIDGGQHWQKYEGNPVVPHIADYTRDPKVIWHEASHQWVMALYLAETQEHKERPHHFALFVSPDLKQWQHLQDLHFSGNGECPDFFPLPLDGNAEEIKWIYWTASGHYMVGTFDGSQFIAETTILDTPYFDERRTGGGYGAQTWSGIPAIDGRLLQIAWLVGDFPGMPFNHQMTFPIALTLKSTKAGPRLYFWPVSEINNLYKAQQLLDDVHLSEMPTILPTDGHDLLDIQVVIEVGDGDEIELNLRGISIIYDVNQRQLSCGRRTAELRPVSGQIELRVLLDRGSLEIFAADGLVYMPISVIPDDDVTTCFLQARGGHSQAKRVRVVQLKSAWT